jgi:hypothetical protein
MTVATAIDKLDKIFTQKIDNYELPLNKEAVKNLMWLSQLELIDQDQKDLLVEFKELRKEFGIERTRG